MTSAAVVIIVTAIIAAALIIWMIARERNRNRLRSTFGPEYERLVHDSGHRGKAEEELARREKRVRQYSIRELTPAERERYIEEWRSQQGRFIDEPGKAVSAADTLVTDVMKTRGYPLVDFETQAADLSVHHARVVENYREAHAVIVGRQDASTEDMRRAMVCYRSLFEELVGQRMLAPQLDETEVRR
jgi:hypothetical protein